MFTFLTFNNFRGFERLELTGLKRVNLVVGRNNAGKTSLLEGIALVCNPAESDSLPTLFRSFSGEPHRRYFRWLIRDGELVTALLEAGGAESAASVSIDGSPPNQRGQPPRFEPVGNAGAFTLWGSKGRQKRICRIIPVQHHSPAELVKLFAAAVRRKGGEERIESLLHDVDPRIVKVRVEPADDGNHLLVDLGLSEMLPVSQVGQGIYRLIAIFSELIGETPDVCIIDEIENGIHHSMLEQVWTGLAAAAESLGVQVFATTHSQECIEAAHACFSKRPNYDFAIVQLFRVERAVRGKVLDRKHIEAAMAGEIDLR